MPIGAQPPNRRGTVGHPYSALNLRLALAVFGLVCCIVLAVLMLRAGATGFGWVLAALALVSVIDIVVVQLRRRARRRSGDTGHSLFE
jgi:predicted metal-binding membrane protein